MKNPIRTTIAFDEETAEIFEKLKDERLSQSEIVRNALKFYYVFREFEKYDMEKLRVYVEMLAEGEHVILDLDHLVILLDIVEKHGDERFWEMHREIARNHAEQFSGMNVEEVLKRLEACNFFRLGKGRKEFVLVFGSDHVKRFMKVFLEEVLGHLVKDFDMKENLTKIRIRIG
jgi:hypothetical protein